MAKLFEFYLLMKLFVGVPFFIRVFTRRGKRLSSQPLSLIELLLNQWSQ